MTGSFDSITTQQEQLLAQAQAAPYRATNQGEDLKIYFYRPPHAQDGPRRPVVLFFFSSNWDRGNVIQFAPHALHFVDRGAVCGLVEYRTKSTHPASTPLLTAGDALAAIRFVRYYQENLHIDPEKVIVMGAGAGANITGCSAFKIRIKENLGDFADASPVPNAAVLLSTIIDIHRRSFAFNQFKDHPSEAKKMSLSLLADHSSPACPLLMIHGTEDRLTSINDAETFAAKVGRRKKSSFEFHPFEGRDSNFYNLNMDPVSFEAALNLIDEFLVRHELLDPNEDPNGASLVSWREEDY